MDEWIREYIRLHSAWLMCSGKRDDMALLRYGVTWIHGDHME